MNRYSAQMNELFTEVYNQLPLCHCINNKILASVPSCLSMFHDSVQYMLYVQLCVISEIFAIVIATS